MDHFPCFPSFRSKFNFCYLAYTPSITRSNSAQPLQLPKAQKLALKDPSDVHVGGCKKTECLHLADCVKKCNSCGSSEKVDKRNCRSQQGSALWSYFFGTTCKCMFEWVMFQKEVANMFTLSHFESWSFYLDFFEVHVQACYTWTMETRCLRTWTSHALCKRRMLGISKVRLTMSAWFQCAIIYADPTSLCSLIGLIYLKHICIFIIDASGFRLAWSSEFWQNFDLGHATKPEDTEPTVSTISKISGRGQVLYVNSRNPACAPSHNIRRCRSRDAHKHRLRAESTFSLSIVQVLTWWEIESPPACTKKHWNKIALKYFNKFWFLEDVCRRLDLWSHPRWNF